MSEATCKELETELSSTRMERAQLNDRVDQLESVINDVNEWLKRTDRAGTAHQQLLEDTLAGKHRFVPDTPGVEAYPDDVKMRFLNDVSFHDGWSYGIRERDAILRAFDDVIVWAARYAHGSATYAPSTVRSAVKIVRRIFPGWLPMGRVGLEPITPHGLSCEGDDLTDVFPPEPY